MEDKKEETVPLQPQQQYHYLYGSLEDDEVDAARTTTSAAAGSSSSNSLDRAAGLLPSPPPRSSSNRGSLRDVTSPTNSATFDQESLVGENIVLTDNEIESPRASEQDFQQLLMSSTPPASSSLANGGSLVNGGRRTGSTADTIITLLTDNSSTIGIGTPNRRRRNSKTTTTTQFWKGFGSFGPCRSCCGGDEDGNGGGETNDNGSISSNRSRRSSKRDRGGNAQFRRKHPVLFSIAFVGAIAVFVFCFCVVLFPKSRMAELATTPKSDLQSLRQIPFPLVKTREADPVEDFIDMELFHPSFLSSSSPPVGIGKRASRETFSSFVFPFPTGAFWTNLVIKPTTADRGLSYPITVYPYAYAWNDDILQVSYPAQHRKEEAKAIHDYFIPDMQFSVVESTVNRRITYFDALSVTLRYTVSPVSEQSSGSGPSASFRSSRNPEWWETYLVQGSPYVTLSYDYSSPIIQSLTALTAICPRTQQGSNVAPLFEGKEDKESSRNNSTDDEHRKLSFGICSISDKDDVQILRGVQFLLQTNGQSWMVFSSEPIEFVIDAHHPTKIVSLNEFSGTLRLAWIPTTTQKKDIWQIDDSKGLQRLIYHAGVYPTKGDVSWSFRQSDSAVSSGLKMAVQSITGSLPMSQQSTLSQQSTTSFSQESSQSPGGSSGRVATLTFDFTTKTFSPSSSAAVSPGLLLLALPHHAAGLPPGSQLAGDEFDLVYKCIKGPMRPVLGSSWSYDISLPSLGFDHRGVLDGNYLSQSQRIRSILLDSLKLDVKLALPTLDENIYGFGKQVARLAQLVHISHELLGKGNNATAKTSRIRSGRNTTAADKEHRRERDSSDDEEIDVKNDLSEFLNDAKSILSSRLQSFFDGNVTDFLIYDTSLGGITTSNAINDPGEDFGSGRYNDHHFHYGYLLYACAVMGRLDPSFVERYGAHVDSIYADVAYENNIVSKRAEGLFFPAARHKVWFDGHSFASGLFPFANGKSQESSSEAVNCYYGAYLWSLVKHGAAEDPASDTSAQTDFARLLLATEIRGAQTYWHMIPANVSSTNKTDSVSATVYSNEFSKNYMVGNLGMLDVTSSTWFGTNHLYVHLINEIPVTAVTEDLFNQRYVTQEYNHVLKPLGEVEMAWRGYLVCNQAMVNAEAAWEAAQKLYSRELDSALSLSQVLYWVATRGDFSIAVNETSENLPSPEDPFAGDSSAPKGEGSGGSSESSCSSHHTCADAGLTGQCCPTADGLSLECCGNR